MHKKINKESKMEAVSLFIDDLNNEEKPKVYEDISEGEMSEEEKIEMEGLLETIRAVKRLRSIPAMNENSVNKNRGNNVMKKSKSKGIRFRGAISKIVASVAVIALIFFASESHLLNNSDIKNGQNNLPNNIAYAVEEAYNNLESYTGVIEIISIRDGNEEYSETIEIKYKSPNKFLATHNYNGFTKTQISDGYKLTVITPKEVTIDYSNPRKELWRYHIVDQVQELKLAKEINKIGEESFQGREAIVYKYRFSEKEPFNKVWIDKKTKMLLKTELNNIENVKLINQFTELNVNAPIDDSEFDYTPEAGIKIVELNSESVIDEISKDWDNIDNLLAQVPQNFTVDKVVKLDDDIIHDYLIKLKDYNTKDFLDIYICLNPASEYYSTTWDLGKLQNGWVMSEDGAVNVFKVYIGESSFVKWVTPSWEIRIVSSKRTKQLREILESTAGEKISSITIDELKEMGAKPMETKPGH